MKLLTAAEMRQVDQQTIAAGTPGIVLMENAAHRVVEFLAQKFAPLHTQRIVVLSGDQLDALCALGLQSRVVAAALNRK